MRNGHWLRGNRDTVIPRRHVCVATSVRPAGGDGAALELDSAELADCTWHDGRFTIGEGQSFGAAEDFWAAIARHAGDSGTTWIWLRQPAQDLVALRFTELVERREFVRAYWVWSDPPVIIAGTLHGRRVKLVGLANWCETCLDVDGVIGPDLGGCIHGVRSVLSFVYREDLGHLCATIGGQSLQSYRHLHLNGKVGIHNNALALRLEREAALGVPIRIPRLGAVEGPIHVLDVNALYPYVMASYPYPRKLLWHCTTDDVQQLRVTADTHLLIARVSGYDEDGEYLVRRGERYSWDSTLNQDVLAGPDLDRALWRGKLDRVHAVAAYEGVGMFASWGTWAWELRQRYKARGDPVEEAIAKALTVALWGRFAARLERWEPFAYDAPPGQSYGKFVVHRPGQPLIQCRAIAGVVDRLELKEEPDDSMPSVSVFVASYARMYVHGLIAIAGWPNLVYQCADSIHVNEAGYQALLRSHLVDPAGFGKLKLVRTVPRTYYHAANVYQQNGLWTFSGRKLDARETAPQEWQWTSQEKLAQAVMRAPDGLVRTVPHKVTLDDH